MFYLRKTPATEATTTSTKKVVLNRNPIVVAPIPPVKEEAALNSGNEESKVSSDSEKNDEKKVVKLGTLSVEERAKLRAQKFGVPLSNDTKKMVRAERFGLTAKSENTDSKEVTVNHCLLGILSFCTVSRIGFFRILQHKKLEILLHSFRYKIVTSTMLFFRQCQNFI